MGGEGSMMAANNSLKNNRSLLAKRKEKQVLGGSYSKIELQEFPEATPEVLRNIRETRKREQKQQQKRLWLVFLAAIVILIFLGYLIL